jgi:ATP/ADP translocase
MEAKMKKVCNIVGIIVLFIGIIGSMVLAWYNESVIYLICGIFNVAIVAVILFALEKILEQQESLSNKMARIENKLVTNKNNDNNNQY